MSEGNELLLIKQNYIIIYLRHLFGSVFGAPQFTSGTHTQTLTDLPVHSAFISVLSNSPPLCLLQPLLHPFHPHWIHLHLDSVL